MRKYHPLLAFTLLPISLWAATITGQIQFRIGINTLTGFSGSKVTLSNGTGANAILVDSTLSDSTGQYTFSNVTTGFKQVTASAVNFQDTTRTVFIRNANRTSTINLELKRVTGTLSGTVRSNTPDSAGIPNALVLCLGMMNSIQIIDSVLTDSLGNYSISLPTGGYEIRVSAAEFKSTVGQAVLDTTASILLNGFTTLNVNLAPATSTIAGNIRQGNATTGPPIAGATVILQRRIGTTASWTTLDSTMSDANGIYVFTDLIAASGGATATSTNYRILTYKIDTTTTPYTYYGMSATNHTPVASAPIAVTEGATVILNMAIIVYGDVFTGISPSTKRNPANSNTVQAISIYNLNGRLRQQVEVQPGASQAVLTARYAPEKGFLFLMK